MNNDTVNANNQTEQNSFENEFLTQLEQDMLSDAELTIETSGMQFANRSNKRYQRKWKLRNLIQRELREQGKLPDRIKQAQIAAAERVANSPFVPPPLEPIAETENDSEAEEQLA